MVIKKHAIVQLLNKIRSDGRYTLMLTKIKAFDFKNKVSM